MFLVLYAQGSVLARFSLFLRSPDYPITSEYTGCISAQL